VSFVVLESSISSSFERRLLEILPPPNLFNKSVLATLDAIYTFLNSFECTSHAHSPALVEWGLPVTDPSANIVAANVQMLSEVIEII